jgi:hypothetical protein
VPGARTLALAINDRSDVVGIYEDAQSQFRSFLWRRGNVTRIASIPDQLAELVADINDRREVLMWAFDSQRRQHQCHQQSRCGCRHRRVSRASCRISLAGRTSSRAASPSGFLNTIVFDVDKRNAAVGLRFTISDQPFVATLWPRRGAPVNRNTLIAEGDPLKPFVHLGSASLINDRGVIVAAGSARLT